MMADIHPLITSGIIVPLAEFRMITDAITGLHQALANLSAVLIDRLDCSEADPDLEDNGDTEPNGDERDISAPEWHTRHHSQRKAGYEMADTGGSVFGMTEDDEEDDPSGQCDEDGINTSLHVLYERTAGCVISDDDREER